MKKALIIFAVLVFSMSLMAQQRAGTIYGKVLDAENNPLPGVTVTLNGPAMAPLTTVTSDTGMYRFPSTPPGSEYVIKAELQGFKSVVREKIIVTIGTSTEINITLEVGKLEEQVTVTAASPVVDPKKTTQAMSVNKEEMQSLPTSRDPWTIIQLAPSIMVDRENVGGNESTQQTGFIGKGDITGNIGRNPGANNIWAVDGIDITDPAALGGSALYYDFDMFEELNITTGGAADVTIQTGGIALNMVTRRGGNKTSLAGRFFLTDNFFQSNNLTQSLKDQGIVDINKIQQIKDYGFNAGGPVLKDKLWWWGAYGIQDIFIYNMFGTADKSILANYNFKLNAQIFANNRFEALVTSGAKEKYGRNAGVQKPEGDHQTGKYVWGSPIVKLQDEHVFGNNIYLSLKYSFNDAGFGWVPITDEGQIYPILMSQTQNKYVAYASGMKASWGGYSVSRPRNNYQLNATYFNDTLFGLSHEIKVGAEFSHKKQDNFGHGATPQGFSMTYQYNSQQMDVDGNGTRTPAEMAGWYRVSLSRSAEYSDIADQYAGYIQDTITKGNFTLTLGLRYDLQKPSSGGVTRGTVWPDSTAWQTVFDTATTTKLASVFPAVTTDTVKGVSNIINGSPHAYSWATWSPRIGLTWDVTGDGKTVAKLALSQYGDIMGVGWWANAPLGSGGSLNYWWKDSATNPGKVDLSELYWNYWGSTAIPGAVAYAPYAVFDSGGNLTTAATAALTASGAPYNSIWTTDAYRAGNLGSWDYFHPIALDYVGGITDYFYSRSDQASTRTREILLTLERELFPDFAASVNLTYRRMDKMDTADNYFPTDKAATYYPGYTGPLFWNPRDLRDTWYVQAGEVPDTFNIGGTYDPVTHQMVGGTTWDTGDAAGKPYYLPSTNYITAFGSPFWAWRKSNAYNTYMGMDLILTKRLSNRWFANVSFTWQDERAYWGDDYWDTTNKWANDGKVFTTAVGTLSGKSVDANMFTRWMVKFSALYQLPYGFDISATANGREGWKINHGFWLANEAAPNYTAGYWAWIQTQEIVKDSLPTFFMLSLRLEKRINVGTGRLYLMADVFNVFNSNMINRAYSAYIGDAIYNTSGYQYDSWKNPTYRQYVDMLNPRIWRFGVRFEF